VAQYYQDQGRHIVTSRTEHKAVLDPCRELERRGWRVTYLAPISGGVIHPDQVAAALRPDTVLVSLMQVNNEIGVIQDIAARFGGSARGMAACACMWTRRRAWANAPSTLGRSAPISCRCRRTRHTVPRGWVPAGVAARV
jgi:hypothetical protein